MSLLFAFPEQKTLGAALIKARELEEGAWEWRYFPDGESYVRVLSDIKGQKAIILCSLDKPDEKILPLIYLARTLKELGAGKVTLVAPYLGYMRQDKRFHEGEAVTSEIFAGLLSQYIDALVTIDPHLHRHEKLEEIYDCECRVLTAAPLMAQWISKHVKDPVIIGPDAESEQWVRSVAGPSGAPYVILNKIRRGDRDVEISLPDMTAYRKNAPVLLDDVISTGTTLLKTIELLRAQGYGNIACLATHGLFAGDAGEKLRDTGKIELVTANTVPHPSNGVDVTPLIAGAKELSGN